MASTSTLISAYTQSDLFGKMIFLLLIGSSILCWVTLVYKWLQLKQIAVVQKKFIRWIEESKEKLLGVAPKQIYVLGLEHPLSAIFYSFKYKALELLQKNHFFVQDKRGSFLTKDDIDILESHVLTTSSRSAKELHKHLFVLSTIQGLAPFLGLLGTVWGILLTFGSWKQGGAAAISNAQVLSGLATALVTTVLGLLIAIPALIGYNYLKERARGLHLEQEDFIYVMLSHLEMQYRKDLSAEQISQSGFNP